MKRMNLRKTLSIATLVGATLVGANVLADPPQGAYGMGAGMMGGMMGPGMMGGYGPGADLNLTAEQRSKIAKIQNEVRRKQWDLMGKMHDQRSEMQELYSSDKRDDAALSKSYRAMSELRNQMFDLSLATQKQIDAVLTNEQRDKLKRGVAGMHGR